MVKWGAEGGAGGSQKERSLERPKGLPLVPSTCNGRIITKKIRRHKGTGALIRKKKNIWSDKKRVLRRTILISKAGKLSLGEEKGRKCGLWGVWRQKGQ